MAESGEPWSLVVGRVVAPFGTKGAVRVRPETDFPERFHDLREVCLELSDGREETRRVQGARITPRGILLSLEGCLDRDQAAALRGAWVKVRESDAVPLGEGEYYVHQIIGLRVVTEEGRDLGQVTEVIRTPANDVYVTPAAMVPAVRQVVRRVDLAAGRMVVSLPLPLEGEGGEGED